MRTVEELKALPGYIKLIRVLREIGNPAKLYVSIDYFNEDYSKPIILIKTDNSNYVNSQLKEKMPEVEDEDFCNTDSTQLGFIPMFSKDKTLSNLYKFVEEVM